MESRRAGLTRRAFVAGAAALAAVALGAGRAWGEGASATAASDAGESAASAGDAETGDADAATGDAASHEDSGDADPTAAATSDASLAPLPAPQADPDSDFGVDASINMGSIDQWLGRDGVAYRDMRMIFDPARWEDMGEDPYASKVLPGFKLVPYPYLATMGPIPVTGYYEGDTLFTCEWSDEGDLLSVKANYKESMTVLRDLFPQDKAIFLCCGGAGYANFTKQLLLYLGWDEQLVYNVGGMWYYQGDQAVEVVKTGAGEDSDLFATWRADYALIDFTLLRAESVKYQDHRG